MKKKITKKWLVSFVGCLFVLLLLTLLLIVNAEKNHLVDLINTRDSLALREADQVKGYTCGFFTVSDAEAFLGAPVIQKFTNYSGFSDNESREIKRIDNCRYESKNSSALYAEFYIETYGSSVLASDNFESHLPLVSQPIVKTNFIPSVEQVLYDAGVYYILKGRHVIQVAASNGIPSQSEQFAAELVRLLAPGLH